MINTIESVENHKKYSFSNTIPIQNYLLLNEN